MDQINQIDVLPFSPFSRSTFSRGLFETNVWVATSDDIPGLATEGETVEMLIEKLKIIIPELLEANGVRIDQEVPFKVMTRRFEIAQTAEI
jgi:predicted RNase H-like HicB family nuclease